MSITSRSLPMTAGCRRLRHPTCRPKDRRAGFPPLKDETADGCTLARRPGPLESDPRNSRLAFCITVYNEAPEQLEVTLASLRNALHCAASGEGHPGSESSVAVVVDGLSCSHPALVPWLQAQGLLTSQRIVNDGSDQVFEGKWRSRNQSLSILVLLKGSNRGKLDSHALFFGTLCRRWQPRLCFQLDCGTVVAPDAVQAMLRQFELQPDTAALAATIDTPEPALHDGPLTAWQHLDFSLQARVHLPAEVASGHLSVLPGQFCAVRWAALQGGHGAPLERYLRGLEPSGPIERTMYLAEDRVMGSEIILDRPAWQLRHCPGALATTDACAGLRELQRQRRRWINGSNACRLWLAIRLLCRPACGGGWARASGMVWQLLLLVMQALTPAVVLFTLLQSIQAAQLAWRDGLHWPVLVWGCMFATATVLSLRPAAWPGLRDAAWWFAMMLGLGLLARTLSPTALSLLTLPHLVAAWIAGAVPARRLRLLRRYPEYLMLTNPVLQLVLSVYALIHLADTSWGTKGLAGCRRNGSAVGLIALGTWLLVNGVVVAWAHGRSGWLLREVNPVLEVAALHQCASLLLAWAAARLAHDPTFANVASLRTERTQP